MNIPVAKSRIANLEQKIRNANVGPFATTLTEQQKRNLIDGNIQRWSNEIKWLKRQIEETELAGSVYNPVLPFDFNLTPAHA